MRSGSVVGADEFIRDLQRLGNEMPQVEREMLQAGGQELADAWKREIEKRGFVDSGDMLKGVRYQIKRLKSKKGALKCEITSHGEATKKGKNGKTHTISNAAKAFYLHYGTSRGIPASHWIDAAEAEGYPLAEAAMRARLDQALNNTIGAKR